MAPAKTDKKREKGAQHLKKMLTLAPLHELNALIRRYRNRDSSGVLSRPDP